MTRAICFPARPRSRRRCSRHFAATRPRWNSSEAMSFPDAKRPVTKGLLQRIDLSAILIQADGCELAARAGCAARRAPGHGTRRDRPDPRRDRAVAGQGFDEVAQPRDQQGRHHGVRTDQLLQPIRFRRPRRSASCFRMIRRFPGRSRCSTCCTASPTTTRSGCAGRASSDTSRGCRSCVVMPDGGRGWYTNAAVGYAYEDDLIKDVVGLIDRTFPVKAERAGRAIGGLSMGGYGAVKVGLKHHEMFASVNSHSGALAIVHREHRDERPDQGPRSRAGADLRQDSEGRSGRPVRHRREDRPRPPPRDAHRLRQG